MTPKSRSFPNAPASAVWSKQGIMHMAGGSTVEASFVRIAAAALMGTILALPRGHLIPWFTLYFKGRL